MANESTPTFSAEEEEVARQLLIGTKYDTVQDLLDSWKKFVSEVEEGYRLGLYDYNNELTKRQILDRFVKADCDSLRRKIVLLLRSLDLRFLDATFLPSKPPFPGALMSDPASWWFRRLPTRLVGELARDAEKNNLVS